jgi:hypothetical protein
MEKESDGERYLTTVDTARTYLQPEVVVTVGHVRPVLIPVLHARHEEGSL